MVSFHEWILSSRSPLIRSVTCVENVVPSPYKPPTTARAGTDASAGGEAPRTRLWVTWILASIQLMIGSFGMLGVVSYATGAAENPSRYQSLFVPLFMFVLSVPILILSASVYRRARPHMKASDKLWFNTCSLVPILALIAAMFAPWLWSGPR